MPSHHKHLHARQGHQLDDFVQGVESVANDLNPFKDAPSPTLQAKAPETKTKTVYFTMSATFDGPVAGYTTVGVPGDPTPTAIPSKPNSGDNVTAASSPEETPAPNPNTHKSSENLPQSLAPTSSVDLDGESTLAVAPTTSVKQAHSTTAAESTSSSLSPTDAAAAASSSPSSSPDSSSSGNSAAAKAGIAIGVLGGLLVVGLLIFFLFNRRKKQLEKQRVQDDEKVNGAFVGRTASISRTASVRTTRTTATAPRLSLRPVTEFNPTFNERRSSKGAGLMLATPSANPPSATREKGGSLWERPSTAHSNNPENPFNDAERAYTPTANESSAPHAHANNPFDSPEHVVGMAQTTDIPTSSAAAIAAGATGATGLAAGTSLTRKASTRKEAPEPLDLTMPTMPTMPTSPPSPTGTEYSMTSVAPGQSPGPSKSAAAIAEAGGPASTTVHRVQLDFKPSMEDEMELRAGHLVRILHEYDDGWALCIRLDRSQQGVVPRTCLSTRPVKPRPAGGPPGPRNGGPPVNPSGPRGPQGPGPNYHPGQRPMTPQGGPPHGRPESPMRPMNGRPQSPAHMRPYSPAGGRPMSPHTGRPASPASGRPMSPGPRGQSPGPRQQRPQSPNGMNRRHSPPGPSPMNPNSGSNTQYRGPPGPPPQGPVGRKPVPGQAY
ncbi:hypothetical protein F5Y19DRAFT_144756 [Xylariaceae sp. FL1651]|nr:hypothetical protein F5Y19DRAFT_144756 [Xylariaceae sp. FL1651]